SEIGTNRRTAAFHLTAGWSQRFESRFGARADVAIDGSVLQATVLPTNGDVGAILFAPSTYFNPMPAGDWRNPDTFSSSILIGRYQIAAQEFVQLPTFTRAVGEAELATGIRCSFAIRRSRQATI